MRSKCPDCGKLYPVTKKQLRAQKTQIYCGQCKKKFTVSEVLVEKNSKNADSSTPQQKNNKSDVRDNTAPIAPSLITEVKAEIIPALLTEVKAEFIPKKEDSWLLQNSGSKPESQPHSAASINIRKKSNTPVSAVVVLQVSTQEQLPWEKKGKDINPNWLISAAAATLIFCGQALYFELPKMSQNSSYRPFLEKLCDWGGWNLADYENLSEFTVMTSSFTPQPDNTIVFKTVINNQAPFRQRLPNIQLNLLDNNENLIAQRIFNAAEYLSHTSKRVSMMPDETVEATLILAAPAEPVGGYNFNLVY